MISSQTLNATETSGEDKALIDEFFNLTKQPNELRQLNDNGTLTIESIAVKEAAWGKAHSRCANFIG